MFLFSRLFINYTIFSPNSSSFFFFFFLLFFFCCCWLLLLPVHEKIGSYTRLTAIHQCAYTLFQASAFDICSIMADAEDDEENSDIIVPPPVVTEIILKTATFVAKHGRAFEEKISKSGQGTKTKFQFSRPNKPIPRIL